MPLEDAVYESSRDAIFAVRGGRIFKCNAVTGAKISESVYAWPDIGHAWICHEPGVDRLFVAKIIPTHQDAGSGVFYPAMGKTRIFKVNPDTLAVEATGAEFNDEDFGAGWGQIFAFGGKVYCRYDNLGSGAAEVDRIDPVTLADETFTQIGSDSTSGYFSGPYAGMFIDTDNSLIYALTDFVDDTASNPAIEVFSLPGLGAVTNYLNAALKYHTGICVHGAYIWLVGSTATLTRVAIIGGATTQFNLGLSNFKPWRIKYFAPLDRLLIAGWSSNTVVSVDPATGLLDQTYSGFDGPWNIVTTPTHALAIQTGSRGLKSIV